MDQGYTVSPVMVETAQEDQVIDFAVEGMPLGYDSFSADQGGQEYFVDPHGQVHHQYENVDFDQLDEYQDRSSYTESDYVQTIEELFGGPNEFATAAAWARENLSEDYIDAFNDAINTGDPSVATPAFEELLNLYQGEDLDERNLKAEPFDPELQSEIFHRLGGQETYNQLTAWASDNLDDNQINHYNAAMESGDEKLIRKAVGWLVQQVPEY